MALQYPLSIRFKLFSFAWQFALREPSGKVALYVRQKVLKLKEQIEVFADEAQQHLLFRIQADRVLDWSAAYTITDVDGQAIGTVRRQGTKSLWRATYEVEGHRSMHISEHNPWVRVVDIVLGEIPVLGWLTGLLLHPRYDLRIDSRGDGPVMSLVKRPSLLEMGFDIEQGAADVALDDDDERLAVLSLVMVVLLERDRS